MLTLTTLKRVALLFLFLSFSSISVIGLEIPVLHSIGLFTVFRILIWEVQIIKKSTASADSLCEGNVFDRDCVASIVPNGHLARFADAIEAEVDNYLHLSESSVDALAFDEITKELFDVELMAKLRSEGGKIAFLHSCSLHGQSRMILTSMLETVHNSGLLHHLDVFYVLNFGVRIEEKFREQYPLIKWIEFSVKISYFEIPTLRAIKSFVDAVFHNSDMVNMEDVFVLYLHTKGVSYVDHNPQIDDWRNMMLFFLVENHKPCIHLLASEKFDAIGLNHVPENRHFSGNFWWASSLYLKSLDKLQLESSKYAAESWALSGLSPRVYVIHSTQTAHSRDTYPRENYVCSNPLVSGKDIPCSYKDILSTHCVGFVAPKKIVLDANASV